MKKNLIVLAFLLSVCFPVFAQDNVVYEQGGKVRVINPSSGFTAEQIRDKDVPVGVTAYIVASSDLPDQAYSSIWKIEDGKVVIDGSKLAVFQKDFREKKFDLVKFQGDLFTHIAEYSNVNLRLEFGAINTFAQNKDFAGIKQYLQFLVSQQIATEGDYGIIAAALLTQGIYLEKY